MADGESRLDKHNRRKMYRQSKRAARHTTAVGVETKGTHPRGLDVGTRRYLDGSKKK